MVYNKIDIDVMSDHFTTRPEVYLFTWLFTVFILLVYLFLTVIK